MSDKLTNAEENAQKAEGIDKAPENKTLRFFISLLWGVVTVLVSIFAFYAMFAHLFLDGAKELFGIEVTSGFGIFAVVICLVFAGITFLVPFLRKKGTFTRNCGMMLLGDGLWWLYLIFTL